ncbi:LuxR C-terminal-related transcriptional regulator [Streptomyces sp. NPDC090303]|uniref:helix-turn-helix transcriptional regulator n=1 Tax=Streptomyces sp. NPDC090303 TaxID=3365960 RepID=UPI00382E2C57
MIDLRPPHLRSLDAHLTDGIGRALLPGAAAPSTFVLTGPAGSGKTHALDRALAAVARAPGAGRAPAVQRVDVPELSSRAAYTAAARLLGLEPRRPTPADFEDALLARLDELCATGPLLLALDGAQQADAASLGFLSLAASAGRDLPLALLVAHRPEPEREQLSRLSAAPGVERLTMPPLDDIDVDALVHEHTGRWPDHRLRTVLVPHRADPLRTVTLLKAFEGAGALDVNGDVLALVPGEAADRVAHGGLADPVGAAVASLQGPVRRTARALVVLGRPATTDELTAIADLGPVAAVEAVQTLCDRGLTVLDGTGRLRFADDARRDAVRRDIPEPLLRVLHAAAAGHAEPAERIRHVVASGAPSEDVLEAVREAEDDLAHAPAVEADLLAAADPAGTTAAATDLAIRRARALARSGQMRRAETVARTALRHTTDAGRAVQFRRILIFVLSVRGDVPGALALVDAALAEPVEPRVAAILAEHRTQLSQLAGVRPLALTPPAPDPLALTLTGLTAEAMRLCLTGEPGPARELAWEASRRHMTRGVDPYEGASSDIWPPFVELMAAGPTAAYDSLADVRRRREERAAPWQNAPHELLRAAIDMSAGRLADAAAAYDTGFELAASGEMTWLSLAVGGRAVLDVLRGDHDAADARLRAWHAAPRMLQFGIPQPARAQVALDEARRRYGPAAARAAEVWRVAGRQHLFGWLALVAPEFARVALRAADDGLRAAIARDLARLPRPLVPGLAPSVHLAEALTDPSGRDTAARARAAAEEARATGELLLEVGAWEEAAVAAALDGDRERAREDLRRALGCAEHIGAVGAARRITGRLRSSGIRVGNASLHRRPTTGWDSLTPTEALVAGLVAAGNSGPDIARTLHVSTRTVQTHVSRTLAKLGLSTRIELAAAHPGPAPRDAGP